MSSNKVFENLQGLALLSLRNGSKDALQSTALQVIGERKFDNTNSTVIYVLSDGQTKVNCAFVDFAKQKAEKEPLKDLSLICCNVVLRHNLVFFVNDYVVIDSSFDKQLGEACDVDEFLNENASDVFVSSFGKSYDVQVADLVAQVSQQGNNMLNVMEKSLQDMRNKISSFEVNLKSKISEYKQYADTSNGKGVTDSVSNLDLANTMLGDNEPERMSVKLELIRYFETKEMLNYMAQKDMIDYLERRDALEVLANKDAINCTQNKRTENSCTEQSQSKPVPAENNTSKKVSLQNAKLIMPFMHQKVNSFEDLGNGQNEKHAKHVADLVAFKKSVKYCAEQNADVELLSFMGNSYSTQFFKEVSVYVQKFKSVKKVVLNDCFTQRKDEICESQELITEALDGKGVFAFDISHNAVSKNGCETLSKFFKTNKCLEFLWADNIGQSQSAVPVFVDALVAGAPPLKFLTQSRNKIEVSVVKIAELVKNLPLLQDFTIQGNTINGPEMKVLVEAFQNNQAIEKINISDNFFDRPCFEATLKLIKTCSNLKSLNISDMSIEEDWVPEVINTLKESNCKWEEFSFDYSEIYDESEVGKLVNALNKGNFNYFSCLGTDAEEEYAEKVLNKMKSALTDKNLQVQFIWDANAEEEKREEEEEDSDFKTCMYTMANVSANQNHYLKSHIFADNNVEVWYDSFFANKELYNPADLQVKTEKTENFSGGFLMPSGDTRPLRTLAGKDIE